MNKIISISLIVFIALIILIYVMFKDIMSKIEFNVTMDETNFNIGSFNDIGILLKGNGVITFNFKIDVLNKSWLNIAIKDLTTQVFYQGQLIGASGAMALKNITINSGSFKQWIEPIDLRANKELLSMLVADLSKKIDPELSYKTELRFFGIKYTYSDRIKIIQTTLSAL